MVLRRSYFLDSAKARCIWGKMDFAWCAFALESIGSSESTADVEREGHGRTDRANQCTRAANPGISIR
ncbi:MAG TPA: hypothetical protein DDW52_18450 [Planctomycetaceae bacterium]|nr:hypothetical protein [Planctomycetaceae bacterium]